MMAKTCYTCGDIIMPDHQTESPIECMNCMEARLALQDAKGNDGE